MTFDRSEAIACAIVGASGYTGAVLAELLLAHPRLALVAAFGSSSRDATGPRLEELHPALRGRVSLPVGPAGVEGVRASGVQVVFLATPHEASASLAPALLDAGLTVVDLSAAFRLSDPAAYPAWYGFAHPAPHLLPGRPGGAVYGLAEHAVDRLPGARLIAAPGCYPTSAILPLRPLIDAGLMAAGWTPIVDSTSGVSGAGRTAQPRSLFCEVSQSVYGVPSHRHTPEIAQHAAPNTAGPLRVVFTPHLGPYDRGILTTAHLRLRDGIDAHVVHATLDASYGDRPFVRLLGDAARGGALPAVAAVRGTNFCDIGYHLEPAPGGAHLRLFSAIDNLVKGASGQAVQALNIALGFDERLGLLPEAAAATPAGSLAGLGWPGSGLSMTGDDH